MIKVGQVRLTESPVGGPPYASNRRSLRPPKRGPFLNPNPLTCSDGRSEICGSPADISRGRNRTWHGARAPSTQTFSRILPSVLGARSDRDTDSMMWRGEERVK